MIQMIDWGFRDITGNDVANYIAQKEPYKALDPNREPQIGTYIELLL